MMHTIFKKMQFKQHPKIYVLGAPASFKPILEEMAAITEVKTSPNCGQQYEFALFFVKTCADIAKYAAKAAEKVPGDGLLWFAYPKKSAKTLSSDISRDHGWQPLGDLGFEGVRQIAIDDDWSALRFRRTEFIQSLERKSLPAMSDLGKRRLQES